MYEERQSRGCFKVHLSRSRYLQGQHPSTHPPNLHFPLPLQGFTESGGDHTSFPPTLILILSRLVHDMERSTISYLVSYGDECFPPYEQGPVVATPIGEVLASAKDIAQVKRYNIHHNTSSNTPYFC